MVYDRQLEITPLNLGDLDKEIVYIYNRLLFEYEIGIPFQIAKAGDFEREIVSIDDIPILERPLIIPRKIPSNMKVLIRPKTDKDDKDVYQTRDRFGKVHTYVYAKELKQLKVKDAQNKAIMAFVQNLEDDIPIILWWRYY